MTATSREGRVLDAVVTLVDTLLDDFDVVELLTDLAERCTRLLDVASAGLLLADPQGQLHLMAATSQDTTALELFQLQADEGPCLDCFALGAPVSVTDLTAERTRWPRFVPVALDAGFASVHAVPLRAAGSVLGAMGLFGTAAGPEAGLSDADLVVGQALAHVASVAILQRHAPTADDVVPALRGALTDRVVVEQAKGYVRERLGVTIIEAFELLRRYARTESVHLTEVAGNLVNDADERQTILGGLAALYEGYGV